MRNFWSDEGFRSIVRRQHGRITWAQLSALGASRSTASRWAAAGRLTPVLPRVYAVGPDIPTLEARLWEAVLYAGPDAMISHSSAAHWRELINHPPRAIEVSTPRIKVHCIPGVVRVYRGRDVVRATYNHLPVTTVPQTMLDLASVEPALVARALGVLDFRRQLDVRALEAIGGKGRRGTTELREALAGYQPALAHTNGELEARFLRWCERWKVPIPTFNARLYGITIDAYWPQHELVVELDGYANHSSPAQLRRDRARELSLRSHGLRVVRYDWELLHHQPAVVHADLMRQLNGAS